MNTKSERLRDIGCAAVLFAVAAFFFHSTLSKGQAFGPYDLLRNQYPWGLTFGAEESRVGTGAQDFVHQVYPWRHLLGEGFRGGEVPLWNPRQMCGTPFAANDQSAVFYPLNIIFLWLPVWKAIGYSAFFHIFLAGFFMFIFIRVCGVGRGGALTSGVAFMFTGWIMVWMPHAGKLDAAVWAPLVFAFFELSLRRRGAVWPLLCGAALGMQFTAGFLQVSSYTVYGLAMYGLLRAATSIKTGEIRFRRVASVLSAAGMLGVLLAAAHVFQVLGLARLAQREAVGHQWGFFSGGIPLRWVITAALPNFFGAPTSDKMILANYTELCCFVGASALFFAAAAVIGVIKSHIIESGEPGNKSVVISLLLLAVVGLFSALGTPLYMLFYYLVPGAKYLVVSRIIFLFSFGVAALAGFGVALVAKVVPRHGRGTVSAAIFFIVLIEFFRFGTGFMAVSDPQMVFPEMPSLAFLRERSGEEVFRIHTLSYDESLKRSIGLTLFPNTATVYGLEDIRGYDSLYLKRYQDFMARVHERDSDMLFKRSTVVNTNVVESKWIDFMNVRYLLGSVAPRAGGRYEAVFYARGDVPVFRNKAALPRAMVLRDWVVEKDDDALLDAMMSEEFDPFRTVALESEPPGLDKQKLAKIKERNGKVQIIECGLNRFSVRAAGPGVLVVSDTYAPGWMATVGGRVAPLLRANYTFRAVPLVDYGENEVEFFYRPMSAAVGMWVSAIAVVGFGAFFMVMVFTRKK